MYSHPEQVAPKSSFVAKLGKWSNSQMSWIGKIPGAFPVFRILYRFVYPDDKQSVTYAKGLKKSQHPPISKLLIVSPQSWDKARMPWKPAMGNYFYDIWQSANERYGQDSVFLHQIAPGDPDWSNKLLEAIEKINPSHVLFQGEEDPNGDPNAWPDFAARLAKKWSGELIFLMYDSVYWWHIFTAEKVARVYPNTSVHAIDRLPNELHKSVPRSGPGVLPTSLETVAILKNDPLFSSTAAARTDLTCVGSLYPDRKKQLKRFKDAGIDVVVNPHREGRSDLPSYIEYASAIGHSWATINLSRNHGMPNKHVKTRVLEAPLFGTLLFSDEQNLSSQMIPQDGFVYFSSPRDLKNKVEYLRKHPEEYAVIKQRGIEYANSITNSIFWEKIEGLYS